MHGLIYMAEPHSIRQLLQIEGIRWALDTSRLLLWQWCADRDVAGGLVGRGMGGGAAHPLDIQRRPSGPRLRSSQGTPNP